MLCEQSPTKPSPSPEAPFFIVLNAGSGHNDARLVSAIIQRAMGQAGRRFELLLVEKPRHLAEMARHAVASAQRQQGIVVAAGGDGTLNTVASATLNSGRPFGVLPQGTFNYFGRTHGIPENPEEAVQVLLNGVVRPVQMGLVNDRLFLVNASLGLHPKILQDREAFKQQFGRRRLVALWSGILTLMRERSQLTIQLEHEGGVRLVRTPSLFIGNNRLQLTQIGIPEANSVERGQLAAIMVRPVGTLAMFGLLLRGALGQLGEAEHVHSFAFRRLTVQPRMARTRRRIKVAIDGEVTSLNTPLVFQVAPQPLLLIVPAFAA